MGAGLTSDPHKAPDDLNGDVIHSHQLVNEVFELVGGFGGGFSGGVNRTVE